jgi:hypothetical protein
MGLYANDPNASKLKADSNYMNAMSAVEVENKNYTINQLNWQNQLLPMDSIG